MAGELIVINITRAHQRVLYEDFLKRLEVSYTASQQLMFPYEIPFQKVELQLIEELKPMLESIGFMIDILEDRIVLSGIPIHLSDSDIPKIFTEIIHEHLEVESSPEDSQQEAFAKRMSYSLAIKTGQTLTEEEQESLINNLFSCQEPMLSPFGRRIYTNFSLTDLDKFL